MSTILDRFRRAAAVPAPVGDDLARELVPVFAALDEIEGDCERVRRDAALAADQLIAAARGEAAVGSTRGREEAEAARAEAEDERRRAREEEAGRLTEEAAAETARIREQGKARLPKLVDAVVACVRAEAR